MDTKDSIIMRFICTVVEENFVGSDCVLEIFFKVNDDLRNTVKALNLSNIILIIVLASFSTFVNRCDEFILFFFRCVPTSDPLCHNQVKEHGTESE